MYRTNTCGELRLSDAGKSVTLAGWVQRVRKMGGMIFVDLRDRYGITQLVFNESDDAELCASAGKLGREFCIQAEGTVSAKARTRRFLPATLRYWWRSLTCSHAVLRLRSPSKTTPTAAMTFV